MPELPEVETVARTLLPHIRGRSIVAVQLLRDSTLHPLSMPLTRLVGSSIIGTSRRGKLLLLQLDATSSARPSLLVAHLRMTGRLLHKDSCAAPHKHTRCVFALKDPDGEGSKLFFDDTRAFGKLLATRPEFLPQWDFWRNLGPEPLELTPAGFAECLKGTRPIKQALLDQRVIAGIGNIYADESLFRARISPLRPANSLSAAETARLLQAIQDVLRLSIAQCGSSIRDYQDADGNAGAFQNSFQAYGQGGKPCKNCGTIMEKIKLGGRTTVFCPRCQKSR